MDFAYTAEDEAFRDELVGWLDENLPKFLAEWSDEDDADGRRRGRQRGARRRRDPVADGAAPGLAAHG